MWTSSLRMKRQRWVSTVLPLMKSRAAIWLLLLHWTMRSKRALIAVDGFAAPRRVSHDDAADVLAMTDGDRDPAFVDALPPNCFAVAGWRRTPRDECARARPLSRTPRAEHAERTLPLLLQLRIAQTRTPIGPPNRNFIPIRQLRMAVSTTVECRGRTDCVADSTAPWRRQRSSPFREYRCGPRVSAHVTRPARSPVSARPGLSSKPLHPLAPNTRSSYRASSGCSQAASSSSSGMREGLAKNLQRWQ